MGRKRSLKKRELARKRKGDRPRAAKRTKTWLDWLIFRPREIGHDTIRRHYERWRQEQGLPTRCDIPVCTLYSPPFIWNGKVLKPILDRVSGNRFDNRPVNLRFLCPNCDSQLSTRGGGNKGRVIDVGERKFTLVSKQGAYDYNKIPGAARLVTKGRKPRIGPRAPTSASP